MRNQTADMGMTQSQSISRLRIKCFSLESRVDLITKMVVSRLWVVRQPESIPGEYTSVRSWFWVNSWKANWVMSWIDSSIRDMLESWGDSNQGTWRMPQKVQWNLVRFRKRSMKLTKSPKQVNDINNWFESLSHDLIRINVSEFFSHTSIRIKNLDFFCSWVDLNINILEAFWVVSRFESKSRNSFWVVSWFESSLVKSLWVMSRIKTFWDWVESNKKIESYPCLADRASVGTSAYREIGVEEVEDAGRHVQLLATLHRVRQRRLGEERLEGRDASLVGDTEAILPILSTLDDWLIFQWWHRWMHKILLYPRPNGGYIETP